MTIEELKDLTEANSKAISNLTLDIAELTMRSSENDYRLGEHDKQMAGLREVVLENSAQITHLIEQSKITDEQFKIAMEAIGRVANRLDRLLEQSTNGGKR